jgi:hypothetical protein
MDTQHSRGMRDHYRGQEPYHSQVLAARPFNGHTMLAKDLLTVAIYSMSV